MVMQNARCIFLHLRTRDVLFRSNEARHYTVSRRAATVHLCAPSISEITPVPRDETELLGQSFDLRSYRSPQFAGSVGSAESGAFRLEDVKTSVVDDQAGTLSLGGAGRRQQGRSRFHGPFQVGSGDLRQRMVARSGGGGAEQGGDMPFDEAQVTCQLILCESTYLLFRNLCFHPSRVTGKVFKGSTLWVSSKKHSLLIERVCSSVSLRLTRGLHLRLCTRKGDLPVRPLEELISSPIWLKAFNFQRP